MDSRAAARTTADLDVDTSIFSRRPNTEHAFGPYPYLQQPHPPSQPQPNSPRAANLRRSLGDDAYINLTSTDSFGGTIRSISRRLASFAEEQPKYDRHSGSSSVSYGADLLPQFISAKRISTTAEPLVRPATTAGSANRTIKSDFLTTVTLVSHELFCRR